MCGRFVPLTLRQVMAVLQSLARGQATGDYSGVPLGGLWNVAEKDAFPGAQAQLILPYALAERASLVDPALQVPADPLAPGAMDPEARPAMAHGGPEPDAASPSELTAAPMSWGFSVPWKAKGTVFNTRIETALRDLQQGYGFWKDPIERGRCVVPCRRFFEASDIETVTSKRSGKQIKRIYSFGSPDAQVTLLGAVSDGQVFSIVTTEPNATMAPIHRRMPLVLEPEEVAIWLGPHFAGLANRSATPLSSEPEDPGQATLF